jgi:hypothetical protein
MLEFFPTSTRARRKKGNLLLEGEAAPHTTHPNPLRSKWKSCITSPLIFKFSEEKQYKKTTSGVKD